jgi:hypothetical protein
MTVRTVFMDTIIHDCKRLRRACLGHLRPSSPHVRPGSCMLAEDDTWNDVS